MKNDASFQIRSLYALETLFLEIYTYSRKKLEFTACVFYEKKLIRAFFSSYAT
jgi:hypothetical protein